MASLDVLELNDVFQEQCGTFISGRLKFLPTSISFKNNSNNKVETINTSELETASLVRRARGQCLKLYVKTGRGSIKRFDGLQDKEEDGLKKFFERHYNMELKNQETALKGWNWGDCDFSNGDSFDFSIDGKTAFDIPLRYISTCNTGKNEVTIELHQSEAPVSLMEIRFFIPPSTDKPDRLEEFKANVMRGASVMTAAESDAIGVLPSVNCLVPRGRYVMRLYPTFVDLHGKSFDYKIPYSQILRAFLLPHKDFRQMYFVISVDPPLKQGQTRYHFIILQFYIDEEVSLELSLSDETLAERYGPDKLSKNMSGPTYDIVSKLFRTLVDRKITVPGTYTSKSGAKCVACSYKALSGYLYPLERGFIFVHKPPIHIRMDEIVSVDLGGSTSSGTGSLKTFDLEIETKSGSVFTFSSVDRDESGPLADFLRTKNIYVKTRSRTGVVSSSLVVEDKAGSDTHDAYLNRVKLEGEERELEGGGSGNDDGEEDEDEVEDDDDDEEDEDFHGSVNEEDEDSSESSSSSENESGGGGKKKSSHHHHENDAASTRASPDKSLKRKAESSISQQSTTDDDESMKKTSKKKSAPATSAASSSNPTTRLASNKTKRSKKEKDPNAPKKPLSAYMLWLQENRAKIKADNPGISTTEVSKIGGELWRSLADKSKWENMFTEAYKQYKQELAQSKTVASHPSGSKPIAADKVSASNSKSAANSQKPSSSAAVPKSKEYVDTDSEN